MIQFYIQFQNSDIVKTKMNDKFNYEIFIRLIDQVLSRNNEIFNILRDYFMLWNSDLNFLSDRISDLISNSFPSAGTDDKYDSLYKYVPEFLKKHLCHKNVCALGNEKLKLFIANHIMNKKDAYEKEMSMLKSLALDALAVLEKQSAEYKKLHEKYMKVSHELNASVNAKKNKVNALQSSYKKCKSEALSSYFQLVKTSESITVEMNKIMARFEQAEKGKVIALKQMLNEFSKILLDMAGKLRKSVSNVEEDLEAHAMQDSTSKFLDFGTLKDFKSDDFFQVFRIHPSLSQYLNKEFLYEEQRKGGGMLYIVNEDFSGYGEFIQLHKGEIVCAFGEEDNGYFEVVNINHSIGKVRKEHISPYII